MIADLYRLLLLLHPLISQPGQLQSTSRSPGDPPLQRQKSTVRLASPDRAAGMKRAALDDFALFGRANLRYLLRGCSCSDLDK